MPILRKWLTLRLNKVTEIFKERRKYPFTRYIFYFYRTRVNKTRTNHKRHSRITVRSNVQNQINEGHHRVQVRIIRRQEGRHGY